MKEKLIDAFYDYRKKKGMFPDVVDMNPEDLTSLKNELSGLNCFVGDSGEDEIRIMGALIRKDKRIPKDTFILACLNKS